MKLAVGVVLLNLLIVTYGEEDLYDVLGVERSASSADIKRAYKKKAREWHPDKNQDDNANAMFMKINEAYETLIDSEKRSKYDNFGKTSSNVGDDRQRYASNPFGFPMDPFGGFPFGGHESDNGDYVTLRLYDSRIWPESNRNPYVLYVYADFCYQCMRVENLWDRFVDDLKLIGIGSGSLNARRDPTLSGKLRISRVPAVVAVLNKKVYHFSYSDYSMANLRQFVRDLLPSNLVNLISDNAAFQTFLAGFTDNKLRVVLFSGQQTKVPLRLLVIAFQWQQRFVFAHVNSRSPVATKYNVYTDQETLLVFNEDSVKPAATLSTQKLSHSAISDLLKNNQYLELPRLSSQAVLEALCPSESSRNRRKLCVVLVAPQSLTTGDAQVLKSFRLFSRKFSDSSSKRERIQFAYVFENTQAPFIHALDSQHRQHNDSVLGVIILWRLEQLRVNYDWLPDGWSIDPVTQLSTCQDRLAASLDRLLTTKASLDRVVSVPLLIDEHAERLYVRIAIRLSEYWDRFIDYVYNIDQLTALTLVGALFVLFTVGQMVKNLADAEEERVNGPRRRLEREWEQQKRQKESQAAESRVAKSRSFHLHCLNSSTVHDLVIDLPAGYRTVAVFVTEDNKHTLAHSFSNLMLPYSNYPTLKFAYVVLDEQVSWFSQLLQLALEGIRRIDEHQVNIQHVAGTVVAINGHRKYFSMYHPKYRRSMRHVQGDAEFLGLDDEDDIRLLSDTVLAGLSDWMAALLDGQIPKIKVDDWPIMDEEPTPV